MSLKHSIIVYTIMYSYMPLKHYMVHHADHHDCVIDHRPTWLNYFLLQVTKGHIVRGGVYFIPKLKELGTVDALAGKIKIITSEKDGMKILSLQSFSFLLVYFGSYRALWIDGIQWELIINSLYV